MATEKNLRESLLQQEKGNVRVSTELRDKILARDEARVRRMKWATGISWVVFVISFCLAALIEIGQRRKIGGLTTPDVAALFPEYDWLVPTASIITQALLFVAVVMTFSLYMRSRTLTMRQIQARLSGIEEYLRRLSEKE